MTDVSRAITRLYSPNAFRTVLESVPGRDTYRNGLHWSVLGDAVFGERLLKELRGE